MARQNSAQKITTRMSTRSRKSSRVEEAEETVKAEEEEEEEEEAEEEEDEDEDEDEEEEEEEEEEDEEGDEDEDEDDEFEQQSSSDSDVDEKDSDSDEEIFELENSKQSTLLAESKPRDTFYERGNERDRRIMEMKNSGQLSLAEHIHVDDLSSDDEDGDGLNTIGRVPLHWYDAYDHIGYDTSGKKVVKRKGMLV